MTMRRIAFASLLASLVASGWGGRVVAHAEAKPAVKAASEPAKAGKPSPWDVSIVEDEFAHNTGEAMLERWENQGGKNQRRFFFFFEGKLWKMLLSLDVSILPEDKKNFATFRQVMEGKYGAGEVN